MKLKEMELSKTYVEYFMIFERKVLKTKSNKDYISFSIGDSSQKVYCKIWDKIEEFPYKEGDVIKAEVEIISWNDNKELKILKHRAIKEEEKLSFESDKFIASITKEREAEYLKYINTLISSVKNENFKKLLDSVFDDSVLFNKFIKCPAAVSHHENYIGGLLKHTFNVLKSAMCISETYPFVNRDLLITSCILHDIGKIDNYEYTSSIKISREGYFLEHISIGALIVSEKINKIENFNVLDKQKLLSCILSSHGKFEWGSPVLPKTIEALILHHSDLIDSQVYYFVNEFKQNSEKEFIFSRELNTSIYTRID